MSLPAADGKRADRCATERNDQSVRTPRWFWPVVLALCVLAGAVRLAQRAEYLANNPFAAAPTVDALTYWKWAGRIAAGQLSDGVPFFSAPLYPYVLGLLRAAGAGLPGVYTFQIVLHLITAGLLAWIARSRFGPHVGVLAAALFLLMLEPASFCLRVLACTLQLFLVCLAWLALTGARRRGSSGCCALAGATLGLLALAYPPALLCLPIAALWWWLGRGRNLRAAGQAGLALLSGGLVIAPATIHNYRACGEFIPISAQAGVTFCHGNSPGAQGTYTPVPGISVYREAQNVDAARIYREQTGREPTWNAVNRFFFNKGWEYWRADPGRAVRLLARKAYWFLTGRNYGDIYQPTLEIAEGLTTRLRLSPLPTVWLLPPALVALVVWLRRWRQYLPELLLFAVPLLVVVAFWFSPRYRLPAVPLIAVGCAWVLWQGFQVRRQRGWTVACAAALAVGIGLGFVNRAVGFDTREPYRAMFYNTLGTALAEAGRLEEAAEHYRRALEIQPGYVDAAANLGDVLARLGRAPDALDRLRRAVAASPDNAYFHDQLGRALAAAGQIDEALTHFRKAVALNPRDPELHNNLGNALLLKGDVVAAAQQYRAALELDKTYADAHFNLARLLRAQGDEQAALHHCRQAVRFNRELLPAHVELARLLLLRGEAHGAVAALRDAQRLRPDDPALANELGWYLATLPGLAAADRAEALRLARQALADPRNRTASRLDTLAAALAANGRFDQAAQTARQAIELAERSGAAAAAEQFRRRLELYRAGKPYVEPLAPSRP